MEVVGVSAIGRRALAALSASGGTARVMAPLSTSVYLVAGAEIVWLGARASALHPRVIVCDAGWRPGEAGGPGAPVRVRAWPEAPWLPAAMPRGGGATLARSARGLVAAVPRLGRPDGFGALLVGARPPFPLDGATGPARALARACERGDPWGAARAARRLLGLGAGLTPSGDDFVGAAFFARALLTSAAGPDAVEWRRAAETIREAAHGRTHPISAALLGDLLTGEGPAPLHDLARALAGAAPEAQALEAAERLVSLGHCSGWDMLAGFAAGAGALQLVE
ncbi:MAG: DUF2877 domain-containing protein [Candidatus Rokubacteria bacterium]|nr:DUF2877 domain-containing protein [Candidatus Rokubacteria bacterium]